MNTANTAATATLERRYRRMLAWFPPEHRQIYGEEMVGVLLASASDGQRRPRPAELADLAAGGLRTRAQRLIRAERLDPDWRDAFAAFSVAAPVLMLFYLSSLTYKTLKFDFLLQRHPGFTHLFDAGRWMALLLEAAVVTMVVALVICPPLIRRQRRGAVLLISLVPFVLGAVATIYLDVKAPQFNDVAVGYTVFYALEVAAVAISRDPGRGWQILGWKSLLILAAVAAATAAETLTFQSFASSGLDATPTKLATFVVALALVLILGSNAFKRMLALMAIPAYPILASVMVYSMFFATRSSGPDYVAVLYLPTLVIALLVGLAIWHASRQGDHEQAGVAG